MDLDKKTIEIARKCFENQSNALKKIVSNLDDNFVQSVNAIHSSEGRLVVTGVGKSAIIGMKISATLNSTGTKSLFMHAADAIHGDLGMIDEKDIVLCISKSGNTPEIKTLIPLILNEKNVLIAITGNKDSFLAKYAQYVLDVSIEKEACPINLAPTTSTTTQLVMGDALAICLLQKNDFGRNDFARFHPGGSIGKNLFLKVDHLLGHNAIPQVNAETNVKEVINEIGEKRLGATAVMNHQKLVGIITDGDIRRMLSHNFNINQLKATDIMSTHPITIHSETLASEALRLMNSNGISQLIVSDEGQYKGIVHLHDLIKEGIY